ncbi:MAG: 16S rRNA (uracil(1498)-N(3))-methyltransferase [Candidatus Marinimicrobia bacterium]|nr:16S rRNA (uracil(1498)-N(3))-methyltransferase [Candidatus Neomarinimicrobiota bacterium]
MHDYHFYSSSKNIQDEFIDLVEDEFKHCCRVLRYGVGDVVQIFDGSGNLYKTKIHEITKNHARCQIINIIKKSSNNNFKIHLGVGLVKSKAFDLIVEQSVSLGIASFYPVETVHSIQKSFNLERYQKKALESIKQSGRLLLPDLHEPHSFNQWLKTTDKINTKLICCQHSQNKMKNIDLENIDEIVIFIGPEGGFSDSEINQSEKNGFRTVTLLDSRLRTELAVITALAGIQTRR